MADPVLRIPIDDEAFKRYMEAFERYQAQLREQPEMWADANQEILDGVAANLSLADAIGQSVSAALRLGDVQDRNAQRRKRDSQESNAEEQRASSWRRKALDHVQELSRASDKVMRGFTDIVGGRANNGGLFGMVAGAGKELGGDIGAIISLAGHALNAGYEANNAVSDKGLFARGIGATLGQQEGFHNMLGRYTNTDRGIDAVMNARGSPDQWWQFNALGVRGYRGDKSNAQVYGDVLRSQVELAKRYTHNGVTDWFAADPRGATAFGTTHEDLNRLKGLSGAELEKAIKDAVSFKTPLQDKQIDAATKSVIAMDNLTTKVTDLAQTAMVGLDGSLDKTTDGLNKLTDIMTKVYSFITLGAGSSKPSVGNFLSGSGPYSNAWDMLGNAIGGGVGNWIKKSWGAEGGSSGFDKAWGYGSAGSGDGGTPMRMPGGGKPVNASSNDVRVYRDIAAYLKRTGLTDEAAFGAAAGAIAESHGNPHAYNKKSGAFGIGQWLGDRKKNYFAMAKRDGVDPYNYYEQLKYLAWELHGGDPGGKAVMGASSIDSALRAYVYKFMRPQGKHNEHLADAIGDVNRGTGVVRAANVGLNVKVSAPPGHQVSVSANSAARG